MTRGARPFTFKTMVTSVFPQSIHRPSSTRLIQRHTIHSFMSAFWEMDRFVGISTVAVSANVCDVAAGKVFMGFDPSIVLLGYERFHFHCLIICYVPHETFFRTVVCQ